MATDTHVVIVPFVGPTPLPHPFTGVLDGDLVRSVKIEGRAIATVGSTATNTPVHVPTPPGVSFQRPPTNRATVRSGSASVRADGRPVARNGDVAETCNDPIDLPIGRVVAVGRVRVGG